MRNLLKFLVTVLLLVLVVAVGTEVAALHHSADPDPDTLVAPVVVRKAPDVLPPVKLVRTLPKPSAQRSMAKGR
ncbi:hypothetical protein Q5H92_04905 [Hymenobacter sp. M29]|uniref:Uncharacterized protein n=1 Tax=Hymenobacter mellowenesis TaxID=3063995 RepID=A0ABT9A764_9BACT|nr:hypothetical protein [Hymenobacter sp. M29]MDO7845686.1 hypothetical protein [Hymenobacter sp. M29]